VLLSCVVALHRWLSMERCSDSDSTFLHYGAVSVSVFLFFYLGHYLSQHPGQNWNWDGRQGSSRDAIDATAIVGKVWPGNCRGIYCVPAAVPPPCLAHQSRQLSELLPRLPSQFQSRPGCWPASKRGNSTYPFAKALVAALVCM